MLDLEELRQEQSRLENKKNSFLSNFARMPEGEGVVNVRILPARKGQKFYCVTRTHRLGQKNIHCPQSLLNGKWQGLCPICNHYRKLWKDSDGLKGEEADKLITIARTIKPLERYYYNCIVRSQINDQTKEMEKDVGPLILSVGKQVHARIVRAILGDPMFDEPELGDITNVETGHDLKLVKRIKKSPTGTFPNWEESKFVGVSKAGTDKQIKGWLESLHDLQALRMLLPADDLQRELDVFRGIIIEDDLNSVVPNKEPEKLINIVKKPVPQDEDESLADAEFMAELRNMR